MNDHPEVPRVTFFDNGFSMNVEEAVAEFRRLLDQAVHRMIRHNEDKHTFSVSVEVRPCDCDETLTGQDEYCPLHGDKT